MTKKPGNSGNYRVGYRKPPAHTRFKPGTSGNPSGKRRGTRNLSTDVKRALETRVKLKRDGKTHQVSTQEALLLRLREKALKGDARSLDRLLGFARIFNNDASANPQVPSTFEDEEILAAFEEEILRKHGHLLG